MGPGTYCTLSIYANVSSSDYRRSVCGREEEDILDVGSNVDRNMFLHKGRPPSEAIGEGPGDDGWAAGLSCIFAQQVAWRELFSNFVNLVFPGFHKQQMACVKRWQGLGINQCRVERTSMSKLSSRRDTSGAHIDLPNVMS